jgi:hypothetical protein
VEEADLPQPGATQMAQVADENISSFLSLAAYVLDLSVWGIGIFAAIDVVLLLVARFS